MNLTRGKVNALRKQQVSGRKSNRIAVVDQVLSVAGIGRAKERNHGIVLREAVDRSQSIGSGVDRRSNIYRRFAARTSNHVSSHNKLLQRTSGLTGLRVNCEHVCDGKHVAFFQRTRVAQTVQSNRRSALRRDSAVDSAVGTGASGELLDRLRHVDLVVTQNAFAHHAVLKLAGDGGGGVKQTFQTFNQCGVSSGVNRRIAGHHGRSGLVQLLLSLKKNQRSARSGAGSANRLIDAVKRASNISVDAGGQLADTGPENTLRKIIQLHGQFGRSEVHTDVLLGSNRQGGELLIVALNLQGRTVSYQSAIRQANTQCGTNFGAFNGKRIVILTIHVTGDYEVVLKNLKSLPCNHVNS